MKHFARIFSGKRSFLSYSVFLLAFLCPIAVFASGGADGHGGAITETFLWLAILLVFSRFGLFIEKIGQPSVLGELLLGVMLGNLALLGWTWFEPAKSNDYLMFLAEFGVVLLLFRIGLESNLKEMGKVGLQALLVALIGIILPFVFGTFVVGEWLFAESEFVVKLFVGAAMTATSVGITARVFKDLGKLHTGEARIVLGAAVIDDVLGLLILAVVSSMAVSGSFDLADIAILSAKAIGFLVAAVVVGQISAPYIGGLLSRIHRGEAMKLTFAVSFALIVAYLASAIGLAAIVGAFAAGLVLDPVHFKSFRSPRYVRQIKEKLKAINKDSEDVTDILKGFEKKHVEDLVDSLGHIFIPLFFLVTGLSVKLDVLFDPKILLAALAVTGLAFLGKILAGFGAYKKGNSKMIVGLGMIPRGEVGLIFANVGKGLGIVNDEIFSIIVIMVLLTTLLTPPMLTYLLKRQKPAVSVQ